MEYDNDRRIVPTSRSEIFCWVVIILLNPLLNSLTYFWMDQRIWIVLLLVNLFVLPAYLLYARIIVAKLLFPLRPVPFVLASAAFFVLLNMLILGIYSLIMQFGPLLVEQAYFGYRPRTLIREGLWTFVNMFLSVVAAFIRKTNDNGELMHALQKDNTLYRLKYLQSQLNPHFLFNTLNSIYSLSLQQSEKTPEVIVKLADMMRYLVYECNEPRVLLDKEIEFIRNYIEIEKIRYKADVRFRVEGETGGIMIEPFLFISFIENGFKHAVDDSSGQPFIYITIIVGEEHIKLTVVNNTNMDLETQARRINGTGISNSKNLLEILYPDAYALDIIQTEKQKRRDSIVRLKNARQRLEMLYPDNHTLDVLLSNNAFTISLIVKSHTT